MRTVLAGLVVLVVAAPRFADAQPASPPPPPSGYYTQAAQAGPDRTGFTAELNLGLGMTRIAPDGFGSETRGGLAGLDLGLGGWINPRMALSLRIAGTSFFENGTQYIAGWIGPSLQYMVNEQAWIGGGLGYGILTTNRDCTGSGCSESGFGLDVRAGYNFYQSTRNAFNGSIEINPGFYDGGSVTSIGLLIGWQHL